MILEKRLHDREFMMKLVWLGFIFSLFLMGLGLYVIAKNIFGL